MKLILIKLETRYFKEIFQYLKSFIELFRMSHRNPSFVAVPNFNKSINVVKYHVEETIRQFNCGKP